MLAPTKMRSRWKPSSLDTPLGEGALEAHHRAAIDGPDSLRAPTYAEWEEFSRSCNLRDMGTHLCALPTGEHCSRGLAEPVKSDETAWWRI
jgi:hypothetical protein